jgi:hypothetical protein
MALPSGGAVNANALPQPLQARASQPVQTARAAPAGLEAAPRGTAPAQAVTTGLLGRLEQEVGQIRAQLGLEPRVMALDGGNPGAVCVVMRITRPVGPSYMLYLTCEPDYPYRPPGVVLSAIDERTGQEREIQFLSQAALSWSATSSLEQIVRDVIQRTPW